MTKPTKHAATVGELAALLIKAAPLAAQLNATEAGAYDRSKFRVKVGSERYFELTNELNAMCGERAWHLLHDRTRPARK